MKRQVFFLIVSTVLLASCQREQDWCGAPDINAEVESEQNTRTSISVDESGAGTIYWNPSDKIDVFFGTKKAQYTSQNASDALAATFKTSASLTVSDVSSTNIWGLYPSNSSSSCNGSSITTTLPSTQYGVPDTFDKDIFPAVAHSSSTNLQFYNVCGGIKFNMAYDDIKKVTFKGNNNENIAGTVSITFTNGAPQATVTSGVKQITLTPKSGSTFTKGTDYYITLLPGTLSRGFTMTFTATDGTVGTLNYTDASVTIKRSIFGRKGNLDVYAAFGDGRQPNNVIYYTSSDSRIITPTTSCDYPVHDELGFGATLVSNEYINGRGVLMFDGDVTMIGYDAFGLCTTLTSIELPNTVTTIRTFAFAECTNLESIEIPHSVTAISSLAFNYCSKLSSLVIPNSVERFVDFRYDYIYNPFTGCAGLRSIIVEPGNPTYDSRDNCNAIIETDANSLISGCMNTVIPNSVTAILDGAFLGCIGLTTIEIPSSVTVIFSEAFSSCSGLASVTIPDSVTSIGFNAFSRCSSLHSIEIPSSVVYIGEKAFLDCTSLNSITVYSITPPNLGEWAFDGTNNCPIYVPEESVDAYKSAWSAYADRIQEIPKNNVIYYTTSGWDSVTPYNTDGFGANIVSNEYDYEKECFAITFDGDVTGVGAHAFDGCSDLTSITLPASVTSIGDYAFWGCTHLGAYIIKNPNPPTIQAAFAIGDEWELPQNFGFHIFVPEGSVSTYRSTPYWRAQSGSIFAIMPRIATSFQSPMASGQTIYLSDHVVYTVSMFGGINLRDDKWNQVISDGEWVVGTGLNGIPNEVSAYDFYMVTMKSLVFDTYGLPSNVQQRISIDWDNQFIFDNTQVKDPVEGTYQIPISVRFESMFGPLICNYSITIIGE